MIIKLLISFIIAFIICLLCISIPIGFSGGSKHEILNDICIFMMIALPIVTILFFLTCIVYSLLFGM